MSKNYNNSRNAHMGIDLAPKEDCAIYEKFEKQADAQNVDEVPKEDILLDTKIQTFEGIVSGCDRLNVRKQADIDSEVLSIIERNAPIIIYPVESNDEWFSVYTESGVKGYCMKKFIVVRES